MSLLLISSCLLVATAFGAAATRPTCGGILGTQCPGGLTCVDDPTDNCDVSIGGADCIGICVGETLCGGIRGTQCSNADQYCVDDPYDDCDPLNGGADCGGFCINLGDSCSLCDMSIALRSMAGICPDGTCYANCGTCTWELFSGQQEPECSRLVSQDRVCPVTSTPSPTDCICTKDLVPVCCRGETYDNGCLAACDGFVAAIHCVSGECTTTAAPCCDVADRDSGLGGLCREGCACCPDGTWVGSWGDANTYTCNGVTLQMSVDPDAFGAVCETPSPTTASGCVCTTDYVPICCDGTTYSNECAARCDGFAPNKCATGECPATTTAGPTAPTAEPSTTTAMPTAPPSTTTTVTKTAQPTTETQCCGVADRDKPAICREGCACCPDGTWVGSIDYVPVCCYGTTFGNACAAGCAGFTPDTDCASDECPETTASPTRSTETTETTETTTTVEPTNTIGCICTQDYAPVCCREETYGNACEARCDGFDAETHCTSGECETGCICTRQYVPLCCGEETYGNSCEAECEGFDSDADCTDGECATFGTSEFTPETTSTSQIGPGTGGGAARNTLMVAMVFILAVVLVSM